MVRFFTELGEVEECSSSRRRRGEYDGEDRISQLPDEIIHTILRQLNSHEEAAGTSLLSRRWLHVWRSYPFVDFELSEKNQSQFGSFVASASRRLLQLLPSNSDHSSSSSCCAAVAAIHSFRISIDGDFGKEDLNHLLLPFATPNGLSPAKFVLHIRGNDSLPCYTLPDLNWSRTRFLMLIGCDLNTTTTFGVHGNHNVVSLGSLKTLHLDNVSLSEELLHGFLANAPRLMSLHLTRIFGIERLEIVSSPRLKSLSLFDIRRVGRPGSDEMRRLRISSPKLQDLWVGCALEDLEIDTPNLLRLSWNVSPHGPLTIVSVVNLPSHCESLIRVGYGFTPQWLRLSLSTTFARFHHVNLCFRFSMFLLHQEMPLEFSQSECAIPPPMIYQLQYEPSLSSLGICDTEEAAAVLDYLFWTCRPKFLSITQCEYHNLIPECLCQEYLKADSPNGVNTAASWRHHLKDMKIEDDTTGEMMEICKDVIPSLAKREKVRFMLIWC